MSIYIESERLILREFTEADLMALVEIANERHICYWCPDWKDCETWVNDWFKGIQWGYSIADPNKEFILLAIIEKATNKLIGQVNTGCEYPREFPGELSIGYFISEKAMNHGYATESAKAITDYYFPMNKNEFFYAVVKPANLASNRVVIKAGFKFVSQIALPGTEPNERIQFNYYRLFRTVRA
jgi:RimJ/RimL family protein N-acetyltransferase